MVVHQVLSGAGPRDAVTGEALAFRARFRGWGWGGSDYAVRIAPGAGRDVQPLTRLEPSPDDVLLIHHSAGFPRLHDLLAWPNRKLLAYHNITPPEWLWDEAPLIAAYCEIGRAQLAELAHAADSCIALSRFSAQELLALGAPRAAVVPPLIDRDRLGPAGSPAAVSRTVLFVGRLSPHKRQEDVIRAFALYRDAHDRQARLALVGEPITAGYGERVRQLADHLAAGAVTIEGGLSNLELGERYRAAGTFLCLSAHEGFCIPVLEAMHLGVPVIAWGSGAVAEVVGDAGLVLDPDDDLTVVAEALALVLTDTDLRAELIRRGHQRLEAYAPDLVAAALRDAVEATSLAPVGG